MYMCVNIGWLNYRVVIPHLLPRIQGLVGVYDIINFIRSLAHVRLTCTYPIWHKLMLNSHAIVSNNIGFLLFFYYVLLFSVGIGTVILGGIGKGKPAPCFTSKSLFLCSLRRWGVTHKDIYICRHLVHSGWTPLHAGCIPRRMCLDVENCCPPCFLHSKRLTPERDCMVTISCPRCTGGCSNFSDDQQRSWHYPQRSRVQAEHAIAVDSARSRFVGYLLLTCTHPIIHTVQKEAQTQQWNRMNYKNEFSTGSSPHQIGVEVAVSSILFTVVYTLQAVSSNLK